MPRFFRLPPIDPFSFLLGAALALLTAWLAYRYRAALSAAWSRLTAGARGLRERLAAGAERGYRLEVLRFAQTQHLAASLFALDDILVPPRVLAPEAPFDPTAPPGEPPLASAIPVLPEWPELAALYAAPTLSAAELVAGETGLVILGPSGAGKTTLLAHLASRAALGDAALFPSNPLPVFVHAADLRLPEDPAQGGLDSLIAAALARAPALSAPTLGRRLRAFLTARPALVLLDGLDELPFSRVSEVAAWLVAFRAAHPAHRVIAAAGAAGYGPLLKAGLVPVHIAPWGVEAYRALIEQWAAAWDAFIRRRKRGPAAADTDVRLIIGWIASGNTGRSVFEVTLKLWAAFSGDARGRRPVDWLEAYLLRFGLRPLQRRALDRLAAALFAREPAEGLPRAEAIAALEAAFKGPAGLPLAEAGDFLDDLVARGALTSRGGRLTFRHAQVAAYCAATSLAADPEGVAPGVSSAWTTVLYFLAPLADLTPLVARRLNAAPDVLYSDLMACAAWLRDAPPAARWRGEVLRRLSWLLRQSALPASLRLRALGALVASADPGLGDLFKRDLASPDPLLRRAAALGLGALGDPAAVGPLSGLLADQRPEVRWAAVLALSALDHMAAIDALSLGLHTGDDSVRRACAEALARREAEGHPRLKDALAHADLAVRRAAVYGLGAVRQDWALALLEGIARSEPQWIVRIAAQEIVARWHDLASRAPRPLVPPHALGWLIAWAARHDIGVPSGPAAEEVLLRALREGGEVTQRAAADAIGFLADPALSGGLYPLLRQPDPVLADAAFRALARLSTAADARLAP
jgi:hypothetical protein